ncbi:(1-_4)-alpha-D-glucan 1-alpha-D-glucosylmutase [Arcanobacterium pluranimalium]|uniref:malto-oligosyltrehalose synthase n=1 Tax=Arcanobacterium pluranimalium TaxID=108028 RepID=UPI00195EB515|nr:malto-oligosyltrehalose synthase [Arcanobacterium pluranimalium]MBM7825485.1 (1->4)-alpha-D-glucan 1-alpha-D-glucosylmutase [Arcanobacterium pluranimalium]
MIPPQSFTQIHADRAHTLATNDASSVREKRGTTPTPVTTYRLQMGPQFTFNDAEKIVPYLCKLGITDVYLSPILQAAPQSTHGYDVVNHHAVSAEMGGLAGFKKLSATIHEAGMRVVVDVVPNHMAVPTPLFHNRALWSVLRDGKDSPYAHWFDIDLQESGDGILMPILGKRIGTVLAAGELTVEQMVVPGYEDDGETFVLRYYDHIFPVRRGTEYLPIAELVDSQFYRLSYWRVANEELNYRRFFDVDTLAAIRVEDEDVFKESHRLLIELYHAGDIDGFRIDHPDGLADPRQYLRQLKAETDGAWVVVEKILEGEESLPGDWPCAGTTGYDALRRIQGLFTDPQGIPDLTSLYTEISGSFDGVQVTEIAAKRQIVDQSLFAEVDRLAQLVASVFHADVRLRDHTFRAIRRTLVELVVHMDRYRAYVVPGEKPSAEDESVLRAAHSQAHRNLDEEDYDTLDAVVELLLGNEIGSAGRTHDDARHEAIIRFQQLCGPVMAKGVEDTTFYRYTALLSMNEVGGGPHYPTCSADEFHAWQSQTQRQWPTSLTTLTTHDTKRGEDTRAQIAALSEHADLWRDNLTLLRSHTEEIRPLDLDVQIENLLWQTLIGTWTPKGPIETERLDQYLLKAAREQKKWTTWTEQNTAAEQNLLEFAHAVISDETVVNILESVHHALGASTRANILTQKALQMLIVGVADLYQGQEITQNSLVDPDNRRNVDYPRLADLLDELDAHGLGSNPDLDTEKMWITSRMARLRQSKPRLASADYEYQPLPVTTAHAFAFARIKDDDAVLGVFARHVSTLERSGGFAQHTVVIPDGVWRNVFTGQKIEGGAILLADLLKAFPAAVLERMP